MLSHRLKHLLHEEQWMHRTSHPYSLWANHSRNRLQSFLCSDFQSADLHSVLQYWARRQAEHFKNGVSEPSSQPIPWGILWSFGIIDPEGCRILKHIAIIIVVDLVFIQSHFGSSNANHGHRPTTLSRAILLPPTLRTTATGPSTLSRAILLSFLSSK